MVNKLLRISALTVGIVITANGIFMAIFANMTVGTCLTILLGLIIITPAILSKSFSRFYKTIIGKIIIFIVSFGCSVILVSSCFLYIYGNNPTVTYTENYLIVLGCGVQGSTPSKALTARLDTALKYLEKNKECKIVVSGGKGRDEDISEAEAMAIYLTEHGVDGARIIQENKSTSTAENFRFSDALIDGGMSANNTAFITSDFHIYRASSLARLQGYSPNHISAPTPWYNLLPCYLREFLAIGQMYIFNK